MKKKFLIFALVIMVIIATACSSKETPSSEVIGEFDYTYEFSEHPEKDFFDDEIGTFMRFTDKNEREYIVLDQDGNAWKYKQENMLDKGVYGEEDGIITIEGDDSTSVGVYANYAIYLFDQTNNEVLTYKKISNAAVFVNVNAE